MLRVFFWLTIFLLGIEHELFCATEQRFLRAKCFDFNHCMFQPPWIDLAHKCAISVEHLGLEHLLDARLENLDLDCEIIFVNLTNELLASFNNNESETIAKAKEIFELLAQQKNHVLCLLLPPSFNSIGQAKQVVQEICSIVRPEIKTFSEQLENLFTNAQQKAPYATALLPGSQNLAPEVSIEQARRFLDPKKHFSIIQNAGQGPLVLVLGSLFSTIGPAEDFRIFPVEPKLQNQLTRTASEVLVEIKKRVLPTAPEFQPVLYQDIFPSQDQKVPLPSLNASDCAKVGWLEIADFLDSEQDQGPKTQGAQKLIQAIVSGGVTGLWINYNPNVLYAKNGIKVDQKNQYLSALQAFVNALNLACQEAKVPLPKLFLGVEIGNNLVEQNLPTNCEKDLWGRSYPDLPQALDKSFWTDQLVGPCDKFLKDWNNCPQGKILPIWTVVVDLEFYNRRFSGTFSSAMGFGDHQASPGNGNEFKKAFVRLAQRAFNLGQDVKKDLLALGVKNVFFYMPTLDLNWFYASFLKGSSAQNATHIFSFASRPDLYGKFFQSLGINATVSPVFMLSKIVDSSSSVVLAKEIAWKAFPKKTPMIWFNRLSRIGHPYQPDQWHKIEQSPAPQIHRDQFMQKIKVI